MRAFAAIILTLPRLIQETILSFSLGGCLVWRYPELETSLSEPVREIEAGFVLQSMADLAFHPSCVLSGRGEPPCSITIELAGSNTWLRPLFGVGSDKGR